MGATIPESIADATRARACDVRIAGAYSWQLQRLQALLFEMLDGTGRLAVISVTSEGDELSFSLRIPPSIPTSRHSRLKG